MIRCLSRQSGSWVVEAFVFPGGYNPIVYSGDEVYGLSHALDWSAISLLILYNDVIRVLSSTSYLSFSLVLGLNEVDNVSLHVSKKITANGA